MKKIIAKYRAKDGKEYSNTLIRWAAGEYPLWSCHDKPQPGKDALFGAVRLKKEWAKLEQVTKMFIGGASHVAEYLGIEAVEA